MALRLGLHAGCSLAFTAALLLAALLAANRNHWSLPSPNPLHAPPDEFSEARAQLLLQLSTRSVRTLGSCDNEVAMPALLLRYIKEQLLLLGPRMQDIQPAAAAAAAAAPAGGGGGGGGGGGVGQTPGERLQVVVGRLSYVLLAEHKTRDAAAAAAAAAAAEAATRLRRVHPPGQVTEMQTCLCGVQQQQQHLLREEQMLQTHAAAAPAAGAGAVAAATGLYAILLRETERELPPLCIGKEQQAACTSALHAANKEDLFSSSPAAVLHAAYKARTKAAAAAGAGAAAEEVYELSCLDGPLYLDPLLPRYVPGTVTPRHQCFQIVRHVLAPPATLSVLLGLLLHQQEHPQHQQHQQQQQEGSSRAAAAAAAAEAEAGGGEDLWGREDQQQQQRQQQEEEEESKRVLMQQLVSLPARERASYLAAAAAADAAATAAGKPLLQQLLPSLLAVDVGLWGGVSGGFSLDYKGMRTALYVGPRNLTVDIHPIYYYPSPPPSSSSSSSGMPTNSLSCPTTKHHKPGAINTSSSSKNSNSSSNSSSKNGNSSSKNGNSSSNNSNTSSGSSNNDSNGSDNSGSNVSRGRWRMRSGLLLAAHYDSAPSSPGIGDDLSMCAIGLEVARAAVSRHLRAANARLLREMIQKKKEEGEEEGGLMVAPLTLNLNAQPHQDQQQQKQKQKQKQQGATTTWSSSRISSYQQQH
ncbi:hypothetical protein ACSSS7_007632 [Eimeria intestinalis]